jgi:hypothetical protein
VRKMRTIQEIKKGMKSKNQDDWITFNELDWLIRRAEKADIYEDLALEHHYQTILDEMDL